MKNILTVCLFVWLSVLALPAYAQTKYRALGCMGSTGPHATPTYWFSKPFLSYPENLPGETEEARRDRTWKLNEAAVTEFVQYIQSKGGKDAHYNTTSCGGYLAHEWKDKEYVLKEVQSRMKSTVSENSNQYKTVTPQYTDFVPSWADKQTGEYNQETERNSTIVVKSVSHTPQAPQKSPPAPTVDKVAERKKVEQKMQQYMTQKSLELQKRGEALRHDYNRRMRACANGDRPNCYFIVSAQ